MDPAAMSLQQQDLEQLSDEDLMKILAAGGDENEQRALDEQAAQAQALMQPGEQRYTTVGGGILGGIGNGIRAYRGALDMNEVKAARKKMATERKEGRNVYAQNLLRRKQAMAAAQPPGSAVAPSPVPQALAASSPFSYGSAGGGPGYTPGNY